MVHFQRTSSPEEAGRYLFFVWRQRYGAEVRLRTSMPTTPSTRSLTRRRDASRLLQHIGLQQCAGVASPPITPTKALLPYFFPSHLTPFIPFPHLNRLSPFQQKSLQKFEMPFFFNSTYTGHVIFFIDFVIQKIQ